ncbi:hypothetical protein DNAM_600 [Pseudomonas phage BroderSalsa]|nr:hypothetical protein DNAM_600 [Pseudomonas phage BroderSalsa]
MAPTKTYCDDPRCTDCGSNPNCIYAEPAVLSPSSPPPVWPIVGLISLIIFALFYKG